VGFEQGVRGGISPAWGAYEGAGPLSRSASTPNATTNAHPLRQTKCVHRQPRWRLINSLQAAQSGFQRDRKEVQALNRILLDRYVQGCERLTTELDDIFSSLELGAGPCATEPCEPRQVRKEATVSSSSWVPQDHLAPLFQDVETGSQRRSRSLALLDVPRNVRLGVLSSCCLVG